MIFFFADDHYRTRAGAGIFANLPGDLRNQSVFRENDFSLLESGAWECGCELLVLHLIGGTCSRPHPGAGAEAAVKRYCARKGPMLLLHGSSAAFWQWPWWRRITGMRWVRPNDPDGVERSVHPAAPCRVRPCKCRHPLAAKLVPFELPEDCLNMLGHSHRERINTMITDIVNCSEDKPHLSMSAPVESAMDGLREFMFDRVYRDGWRDPEEARCDYVLRHLFEYYCEHPGEMPEEFVMIGYRDGTERSVCDFLSCMTDRYATRKFQELFVPSAFPAF